MAARYSTVVLLVVLMSSSAFSVLNQRVKRDKGGHHHQVGLNFFVNHYFKRPTSNDDKDDCQKTNSAFFGLPKITILCVMDRDFSCSKKTNTKIMDKALKWGRFKLSCPSFPVAYLIISRGFFFFKNNKKRTRALLTGTRLSNRCQPQAIGRIG